MHIIADSAADLPIGRWEEIGVTMIAHTITLGNETLRNGRDITSVQFYEKLQSTGLFPTTSQPSPGEYTEVFHETMITRGEHDILVLSVSSGLSGTYNAAKAAIEMTDDADSITLWDSRNLSAAYGWLIEAAALAKAAGYSKAEIIAMLEKMKRQCHSIFTLDEMKYLVHGGRISHLQGLLANVLNLKPLIFVNHETGKYDQIGRARTIKKAYSGLVDYMQTLFPAGTPMHVQLVHGHNPEGVATLRELIAPIYPDVTWRDPIEMSPVLGAHTGPTMTGLAFAPQSMFDELPFFTPQNVSWKK